MSYIDKLERPIENDLKQIGTEINRIFKIKYKNKKKLAREANLAVDTVGRVLKGEPTNIYNYMKVCYMLDLSLVDILSACTPEIDLDDETNTEDQSETTEHSNVSANDGEEL